MLAGIAVPDNDGWWTVPFTGQEQSGPHLCWAAIASAVAMSYNPTAGWTQSKIIQSAFGTECNRFWYPDKALRLVGHYASTIHRPLTVDELSAEIQQKRVVIARIQWSFGGGHLVAISGISKLSKIQIEDPEHGHAVCNYDILLQGEYLGFGTWTHSYLTQP